jgi:hypothetical protein
MSRNQTHNSSGYRNWLHKWMYIYPVTTIRSRPQQYFNLHVQMYFKNDHPMNDKITQYDKHLAFISTAYIYITDVYITNWMWCYSYFNKPTTQNWTAYTFYSWISWILIKQGGGNFMYQRYMSLEFM